MGLQLWEPLAVGRMCELVILMDWRLCSTFEVLRT